MRREPLTSGMILVLWLALLADPLGAQNPPASGLWHGEIELPNQMGKLGVTVELTRAIGAPEDQIKAAVDLSKRQTAAVQTQNDPAQRAATLRELTRAQLANSGVHGETTIDPAVLDLVTRWIRERFIR